MLILENDVAVLFADRHGAGQQQLTRTDSMNLFGNDLERFGSFTGNPQAIALEIAPLLRAQIRQLEGLWHLFAKFCLELLLLVEHDFAVWSDLQNDVPVVVQAPGSLLA